MKFIPKKEKHYYVVLASLVPGDTFRRFKDSDEVYIKVDNAEYSPDGNGVSRKPEKTTITINLVKNYVQIMFNETTVYPCECVLTEV